MDTNRWSLLDGTSKHPCKRLRRERLALLADLFLDQLKVHMHMWLDLNFFWGIHSEFLDLSPGCVHIGLFHVKCSLAKESLSV